MDGWSSPSNDPVLATSVSVGRRSYLLDCEDTTGQPHTAEWLAKKLADAISKVCKHITTQQCITLFSIRLSANSSVRLLQWLRIPPAT
jgi:hypothetical protein